MKFYRYIVCAFLFIGAAIAETININWINDGETYAQTTCEIGGDIILPTTPTKRGHTFIGWAGYTRLEYIESTGEQYIDTGYIPDPGFEIWVDFTLVSSAPYGSVYQLQDGRDTNYMLRQKADTLTMQFVGGHATEATDLTEITVGQKNTFYSYNPGNGSYCILNGTRYDTSSTTPSIKGTGSLYLFTGNMWASHTIAYYGCFRVYNCRISYGSNLVRNFIPAKRSRDGAIGMFDTVSNTFFTNAGTGEFISGPVAKNQNFNE